MFGSCADKTIPILLVVTGFNVLASMAVAGASHLHYQSSINAHGKESKYSWWWTWFCSSDAEGCFVHPNTNRIDCARLEYECDTLPDFYFFDSLWGRINLAGGILSILVVLMFCALVLVLMFMQAAISQLRQGTTCLPGARFGKQFLSSRLSLPKGSHPKLLIFSMPVIWVLQLVLLILMAVLYHTERNNRSDNLKKYGLTLKYDVGFIVLMISFLVNIAVYLLFVCSPSEYIPAKADEPNVSSVVGMLPPPQPVEQVRAQPVTQQQQQQLVAAEGSPYGAAGGGAQTQPPVAAWGPQPPYPPPFRESSGSAVWALFLLVPALLLMVSALGQDVFADTVKVRWDIEYSPPRVMLWNVENCTFKNRLRLHCTGMSFDDAQSLVSSTCAGYAIGTAVVVILSILSVSLCIVLGIQEVRGKEPFPYACAAATIISLLFTGLSWGLPLGALERNVCMHTDAAIPKEYNIGGVTRVSIAAFCLLWGVLAGYIPRICCWGCCTRRADEEEGGDAAPAEEGGNAVTAMTGSNVGADSGREDRMSTYSSVAILVWCLLCLSLSAAVLATPLLHASVSGKKLYLWFTENCFDSRLPCARRSIESATSGLCAAHIGSAAFFIILGTIAVMCAIPFQIQELRGRPVFRFAPIAAALFAATSFGAAFGLVTTAKARYYCSPFIRYDNGFVFLVTTMCLLLLTPVFRVGKVMCLYCYENPVQPDDVPSAPAAVEMTAVNPQSSPPDVPIGTMEPISSDDYSMREEGKV